MVVTGNHLSSASDASMLSLVWDFQFVGAAIYAADRLSPSLVTVDGCSYHVNERTLRIPVANVRAWERVASQLEGLLRFMTDDTWALNFVQRAEWAIQSTLFDMAPPADGEIVVLPLSGGLDSLAGLAKAMRSSEDTCVLATTVVTNRRLQTVVGDIQREVLRESGGTRSRFRWEPVQVRLSYPDERRFFRNSSERARALLYVFSCVAVALRAGGRSVTVCENGIGAISLPMSDDHYGARATKAMHPRTLREIASIVSEITGEPFEVINSGLFQTKGELISELLHAPFQDLISATVSCDRAAYSSVGSACGVCTSCLLRRIAIEFCSWRSGPSIDRTMYDTDLLAPQTRGEEGQYLHLTAMQMQVEALRGALAQDTGSAGLLRRFPDLAGVVEVLRASGLTEATAQHELTRLFKKYIAEFDLFYGSSISRDDGRLLSLESNPMARWRTAG
jgi:hypothetical protein